MVVPMEGTQGFLRSLNELASYLGVHMKHKKTKPSFESANQKLANVNFSSITEKKPKHFKIFPKIVLMDLKAPCLQQPYHLCSFCKKVCLI